MEDDDNDELLQASEGEGEESSSESEDTNTCQSLDKLHHEGLPSLHHSSFIYSEHTPMEFFLTKTVLILTSTALMILLPLYQSSLAADNGGPYTIVTFTSAGSFILLFGILLLNLRFCRRLINIEYSKPPFGTHLRQFAFSANYALSGFLLVYSWEDNRVFCHMQDPLKGLVMVFTLMWYFISCKKLMGLQRIFSATTVIVGLFITVDYGLCNEFRCRGHERDAVDEGFQVWRVHILWTALCVFGLNAFAAYFTHIGELVVNRNSLMQSTSLSTQFLGTISRLVSFQTSSSAAAAQLSQSQSEHLLTAPVSPARIAKKEYSAVHVAFWVHFCTSLVAIACFWLDFIPYFGTTSNWHDFLEAQQLNFGKIFLLADRADHVAPYKACILAWTFLFVYIGFSIASLRFLILCQSAVHTVAAISAALPLTGIWWSLFQMDTHYSGYLLWNPTLSGELVCAVMGLPIIVIGLVLLTKSHFADLHASRTVIGSSDDLRGRHLV